MPFTVGFSRQARSDVSIIVDWIGQRNPTTAARWRDRLLTEVTLKLESDPHRYPSSDEAIPDIGFDLRELLHGRKPHVYRVFFVVEGQAVTVLRVRHAAQDQLDAEDF
jgi:plasmid stabilization system protein ParE